MISGFPYHTVPDGSVALPHHFYHAVAFALVALATQWDNAPFREPWVAVSALLAALISFALVWPRYPETGAGLALVALGAATVAVCWRIVSPDERWSRWAFVLAFLLLLVAWDDLLQHSFGWPTPLDWLWKHGGRALLPSV